MTANAKPSTTIRASVPEPYISGYASEHERHDTIATYRAVCRVADTLAREANDIIADGGWDSANNQTTYVLAALITRAICSLSPDDINPLAVLALAQRMC